MYPASDALEEKVFELLEVIVNSMHRPKTIVLLGNTLSGKGTVIEVAAELAKSYFKTNFCLNFLDIDSTHPYLLLGGRNPD